MVLDIYLHEPAFNMEKLHRAGVGVGLSTRTPVLDLHTAGLLRSGFAKSCSLSALRPAEEGGVGASSLQL